MMGSQSSLPRSQPRFSPSSPGSDGRHSACFSLTWTPSQRGLPDLWRRRLVEVNHPLTLVIDDLRFMRLALDQALAMSRARGLIRTINAFGLTMHELPGEPQLRAPAPDPFLDCLLCAYDDLGEMSLIRMKSARAGPYLGTIPKHTPAW